MKNILVLLILSIVSTSSLMGCWIAAGAAGAEAGYVASQEKRTPGETIDDQIILASVKSKLLADPDVPGLKVNVDVNQGIVKLKGFVTNSRQASRAIDLARNTEGVKGVDSRLVIE